MKAVRIKRGHRGLSLKDRFRTAETIIGLHPTMLRLELSIFLTGPFMMDDTALIHCRYAGTGK